MSKTADVLSDEAYLLGVLLSRGTIEDARDHYKLLLRLPFREYSPLGETIIRLLLGSKTGMTFKEIAEKPEVKAYGSVKGSLVAQLQKLRTHTPWRKTSPTNMINLDSGKWAIVNKPLTLEYLKWQRIYLNREVDSSKFILQHLQKTASSIATDISIEGSESGQFGTKYMTIKAKIPPMMFEKLKNDYGLDVGDVFRHSNGIPKKVWSYQTEACYEFVRGLADISAFFDPAPAWGLISKDKKLINMWQIRFSFVNENPKLALDTCLFIQERLKIPAFVIDWADVGDLKRGRGLRDHLVEFWLHSFEKFPGDLFYLPYKQKDFSKYLEENRAILAEQPKRRIAKMTTFGFCPRGFKTKEYMNTCKYLDCWRLPKEARLG